MGLSIDEESDDKVCVKIVEAIIFGRFLYFASLTGLLKYFGA